MRPSVYVRPNKPSTMHVTRRRGAPIVALPSLAAPITIDKDSECHVTPPDEAARMALYLGDKEGPTLEPQTGTANLIQALYDTGTLAKDITAVERHHGLCQIIKDRFTEDQHITPIHQCFLEYAAETKGNASYSRILMNPPFRHIKKHMAAALSLLDHNEGSTLVALVPVTYSHDDAETLETLSNDTFSTAKVFTKIIRIRR